MADRTIYISKDSDFIYPNVIDDSSHGLIILSDRGFFRSEENAFWPGYENLDWHRGIYL